MADGKADPEWWTIVKTLAGFVVSGHSEEDLAGVEIKSKLLASGFEEQQITKAYEWLDKVALSGSLSESLSMLQPQHFGIRIPNPIETAFISEKLMQGLQVCRLRGLINDELIERLLEGVRNLDTRDWDDEDVTALLVELLGMVIPGLRDHQYQAILNGTDPGFYS